MGAHVQVANYARRARHHLTQLARGPNRRHLLRAKLRTGRRRLHERTWQLVYWPFKTSGRALPRILHQVRAANRAAVRDYTPEPNPVRVTLFVATERGIKLEELDDLGWTGYALGGVDVHRVPGDHVSLIHEPAVGLVAEELRRCFARGRAGD
jgi:thioesterase domain-containing protein